MLLPNEELLSLAMAARETAYAPYSHFLVGAALLGESGKVYQGCNVENAAFPVSTCAERTAFCKAMSEGERKFRKIAIVGAPSGESPTEFCPPCGACRQIMAEFCDPEQFEIILGTVDNRVCVHKLSSLLPHTFNAESMRK